MGYNLLLDSLHGEQKPAYKIQELVCNVSEAANRAII